MEDLKQKLQRLLQSSDWSAEDRTWLLEYLEKNETSALQQIMQQQFISNVNEAEETKEEWANKLLEYIHQKIKPVEEPAKIIRFAIWKRVAAAAVIIMMLGTGAYFLFANKGKRDEIVKTENNNSIKNDVAPGGNKAILQLADGSTIILDSAQNGTLSQQGNTKVLKLENGQLAYNTSGTTTEVLYNTVSTPRGGQYQLTLADGSKVWLNAASTLRFPATFSGSERKVELIGEGYFEVAKNAAMPFKVDVAGKGEVEVLGTNFNINAYSDEATINTTLLEGKVKVTSVTSTTSKFLNPGEQAQQKLNGHIVVKTNVAIDEVMAWKNGIFNFNNATLEMVLRHLSRWYDVDIIFNGAVPQRTFGGEMQKNLNLSQVLRILERNKVQFRIEGKNLIVL
ncbi:MAG: FecR domain-containing protein [Bacteroidota bacterium]|nr:FecR domain-containing protein [Bacteroidota bacterium]